MKTGEAIVTVLLAIVGVAVVAVLVSNNANTGSILGAGGGAFAQALRCALSPVTGGSCGSSVTSSISYNMSNSVPSIGLGNVGGNNVSLAQSAGFGLG